MDNAAINHYTPDYTVTPGEVLSYELELRNMSRTELAKRTGLSEKHIIAILKGKGTVIITPEPLSSWSVSWVCQSNTGSIWRLTTKRPAHGWRGGTAGQGSRLA